MKENSLSRYKRNNVKLPRLLEAVLDRTDANLGGGLVADKASCLFPYGFRIRNVPNLRSYWKFDA